MSRPGKTLMVSTCGTSILTNGADPAAAKLLRDTANRQKGELTPAQLRVIDARVQASREEVLHADTASVRRRSAELNGLLGYYDNQLQDRRHDLHVLLHTDTYQGDAAADIAESYLKGQRLQVWKQTFSDLRTDTVENFHRGISDLIKWCADTLSGYRDSGYHVVFNLTGAYKSIQGWMQTLGMLHADEIVYIFESENQLIRIPRIPISFDEGAKKTIEGHLPLFRHLALPKSTLPTGEVANLPEVFFYCVGGEAELSPWGRLLWERFRKDIYKTGLHEPATEAIRYSDKFKRAVGELSPDRIATVNERIDDLALHLRAKAINPNRLDFKQLKGKPCPPSTHECDAYADGDARRIFAHFENEILVLDDLGPALH